MERDYSKNRRSFRTERSDNRYDRNPGQGERRAKSTYGEKRERKEYEGNRNENRSRTPYRERPNRYAPRRENEQEINGFRRQTQDRTDRTERKIVIKRNENRSVVPGKRSRIFKKEEHPVTSRFGRRNISGEAKEQLRQKHYSKKKILAHRLKNENENTELRLNRYISMGGVCSRRDADELIVSGRVKVNGEVVQTVGMKVRKSDRVEVDEVQIIPEKKIYLVLNKPKDYVTTVEDPLERKTVMSLIEGACKERIYPVGRLDRQTTGVLLFTNDGDLAKKLTHPKYDHKKIYHVFLDKALNEDDMQAITQGIELEDGFIKPDEINYASPDYTEVVIEIHSGKKRIVRRIFEHLGYQIMKLDRVYFAGITKKNLPRGTWRFLTPREVNMLKVY